MIKILANDGIHPDAKFLLEESGFQVDTEKIAQDDLMDKLPDYDAIIVRSATKVRKELIDHCPNLKVIARAGVGLDNIDHEYARSIGREVMNTPAASSEAVAELVFGHMFNVARYLHQANRDMKDGDFKQLKKAYSKGFQLRGKTLGIIGFGRIGRETARIGIGMGMNILPVDLLPDLDVAIDLNLYQSNQIKLAVKVPTVDMDTMLRNSDFISIHVPTSNGAIIGEYELQLMKPTATIINTSRGGMIDETALLDALDKGEIGFAAIDVFEDEPTPGKDLLNHPLISVSPHIGGSTVEAQTNIGMELADKLIAYFS